MSPLPGPGCEGSGSFHPGALDSPPGWNRCIACTEVRADGVTGVMGGGKHIACSEVLVATNPAATGKGSKEDGDTLRCRVCLKARRKGKERK